MESRQANYTAHTVSTLQLIKVIHKLNSRMRFCFSEVMISPWVTEKLQMI
jgi:hypothetical protein